MIVLVSSILSENRLLMYEISESFQTEACSQDESMEISEIFSEEIETV